MTLLFCRAQSYRFPIPVSLYSACTSRSIAPLYCEVCIWLSSVTDLSHFWSCSFLVFRLLTSQHLEVSPIFVLYCALCRKPAQVSGLYTDFSTELPLAVRLFNFSDQSDPFGSLQRLATVQVWLLFCSFSQLHSCSSWILYLCALLRLGLYLVFEADSAAYRYLRSITPGRAR